MKNFVILISILFLLPMTNFGQDKDMKNLFEKYKNVSGFEMDTDDIDFDMDTDGDFDLANFLNDAKMVYVLEFDKDKGKSSDLDAFYAKLEKLIDKKNYKTVIDIEGTSRFRLLNRKNGNDDTSDMLMITEGKEEYVFIYAGTD